MDSFHFDFDTDSTLTNDTTSTNGDLDWSAFQSAPPTISNSPFSPNWIAHHDDAVAPDNRTNILSNVSAAHDDGIYFEIEHFFNGLNQQQQQQQNQPLPPGSVSIVEHEQTNLQPISINLHSNQNELNDFDASRVHHQLAARPDRTNSCLPAPLVPRVSSSRSQCYHKLPDHAVKLMQEWYNANLDDPYPRSPDKKRFITEGNITAQQCRSWFANRRQRLKHVKRNHPRASSSNSFSSSSSSPSTPSSLSRLQTGNNLNRLTTTPMQMPPTPTPTPILQTPAVSSPTPNSPPTQTAPLRSNVNLEELTKNHEHCYYCQQSTQQIGSSPIPLTFTSNSTSSPTSSPTTTTTTLNVVINQQTVEQLIHNSLRKLLYPTVM